MLCQWFEHSMQITILDLGGLNKLTNASLVLIGDRYPGLKEINLNNCDALTAPGIISLLTSLPNLEAINISPSGRSHDGYIQDQGVAAVAAACPKLRRLNLSGCSWPFGMSQSTYRTNEAGERERVEIDHSMDIISDISITVVAKCCPNLTGTSRVLTRVGAFRKRLLNHKRPFSNRLPLLLHPSSTVINLKGSHVTDEGIKSLVTGCPGLTNINVGGCKLLTDQSVAYVASFCPELTHFKTDQGLGAFITGVPKLTNIKCSGNMTDEDASSLAAGCPSLTKVQMCYCRKITDVGVMALALSDLTHMDLSGTCISDAGLTSLAANCPKMVDIKLKGCKGKDPYSKELDGVTDVGVASLAASCAKLTHVALDDTYITDAALISLATGCPGLESVNLDRCNGGYSDKRKGISDVGVTALANNCKALLHINLNNTAVTDVGITALAEKCPLLHHFELACTEDAEDGGKFTDEGLKAIAKFCPGTTNLNLCSAGYITDAGLLACAAHCPKLTELVICHCGEGVTYLGERAIDKILPRLWARD